MNDTLENYLNPSDYDDGSQPSIRPTDYSDSGNSKSFVETYVGMIIYVTSLGWLVWDKKKWVDGNLKVQEFAKFHSQEVLNEAKEELQQADRELATANISKTAAEITKAEENVKRAKAFYSHALHSRNGSKIRQMLDLSRSAPEILTPPEKLDSNPFLLNTPNEIVNLQTGAIRLHKPDDYCSKMTKVSPDTNGKRLWLDFLNVITCGDVDLQNYLHRIAGMFAIGKVFSENLIIAYGGGRNGKSSFFNAIGTVLGDYYGSIKPEVLTVNYQRRGADIANLKGKRMIIASELDEDTSLSTSVLKQLTSTDRLNGEIKYKDPESFIPTHSLVLHTNHLPKLPSLDGGTKRRIVIVPFNAQIQSSNEVKNYADFLVETAGGAILKWIIEGAMTFCENGYKLDPVPEAVSSATEEYLSANDKVKEFIEEWCIVGNQYSVKSGALSTAYMTWRKGKGEPPVTTSSFNRELETRGFKKGTRKADGFTWYGISLNS